MDLARFALRNDKIVLFLTVVLGILGVRAYLAMPQSIFPTMNFARVHVVADAGELPPDRVRSAVSLPLETAFEALPNVTHVRATSAAGSADILIEFSDATDPRVDLEAVDQAIAQVRASIPAAANVASFVVDANKEPVLSYALTSRVMSQALVRDFALHRIAPQLFGIAGLGRTLVAGGQTIELHVDCDPAALAAHGLGPSDVVKAVADAGSVTTLGNLARDDQNYALVIDASLKDAASLRAIGVIDKNGNAIPLSSLATITAGVSPAANFASYDGRHAVTVNAYPLQGADSVSMARDFRARMAQIERGLPKALDVGLFWDQTTLIVDSQRALRDAILLGAALAVLVIFTFLRDVRLTIVAAAVIPVAMAISIFALQLAGQTLNLMSVGGLAVAVGLIIDDAIVVIENIERTFRERPELSKVEAIRAAMSQLGAPMAASTAATVVVFLPLALLGGVPGYFFRALAFTLSTSLVVSLALALFVAPNVARALVGNAHVSKTRERDIVSRVFDRYEPLLRWSLRHRTILFGAAAATLVATAVLLSALPSDFLPKMDEGQFEIGYQMPTGTTLAASDAAAAQMERVVRADPAVASVGRLTAIDSDGISPMPFNAGLLRVRLVAPSRRPGYDDVSARVRDRLQDAIPAANFDFHQILEDLIDDLSGTPAPVEIAIRGTDQATLIALAKRVAAKLEKVDGLVDVASGVIYDNPTLAVAPQGARLGALGLTQSDVADAVSARLQGIVATSIGSADAQIPVRVRVDSGDSSIVDSPMLVKGGATSLDSLANVATQRLASEENDENGRRVVRVTANVGDATLSTVTARIRAALNDVAFPPGYAYEIGGQSKSQADSFGQFLSVIGIAVALVFAVMLATFGSFRLPLVILTAIPLALIGVALGLTLTRTPINVSSFMGLLLLVGIVVKNGILLIDVAQRALGAGESVEAALVIAGKTRLRPIVMTTLAAIGGLVPLALGLGQGAEMERPLAIAVIGGLSTATIFTLIVIPVLFATFAGNSRTSRAPVAAAVPLILMMFASVPVARANAAQALEPLVAIPAPAVPYAFGDLPLANALDAAVANSPDVAAARARIDENRGALLAARGGFAPNLVSTYVQTPQGNPPGRAISSRIGTLGVQATVGDLFSLSPNVRLAAATLAGSQADGDVAVRDERIKTIALYYDALKARALARATDDALALASRQREAARIRFAAGDAPRLDVVRADVGVAKATAEAETARAADQNATDALRVETGLGASALQATAASATQTATEANGATSDAQESDPQRATTLALATRAEILSADDAVRAAEASARAAGAATFPTLTVGAGYAIGTDSDVPINGTTVNVSLAIPLSGAGAAKETTERAKIAEARAKLASAERAVALEVSSAARSLGAAERAATATSHAREEAQAELAASELGYRSGATTSLDLASARSTYVQAVSDELTALYDLAKARATLRAQIGR